MSKDQRTTMAAAAAAPGDGEAPSAEQERYRRGMANLDAISGSQGRRVVEGLADIAPDLGRYIVEFAYGDIFARPGLDRKTREIATVAALTAMGTAAPQLRVHVEAALNVGATQGEVMETILQMIPYAGFPAALNATAIAREVFAAQRP
jgi:4-carboxymuconolactone decarboxylase